MLFYIPLTVDLYTLQAVPFLLTDVLEADARSAPLPLSDIPWGNGTILRLVGRFFIFPCYGRTPSVIGKPEPDPLVAFTAEESNSD